MELPQKIQDSIWDFCRLNKITDIDGFTLKLVQQGLNIEKYGNAPAEKVVEKIVKEVVEVIKEVPVYTEVKVTDNVETNKLLGELLEKDNVINILEQTNKTVVGENGVLTAKVKELETELVKEKNKNNERDIYGE